VQSNDRTRRRGTPSAPEALQKITDERREHPTRAERALEAILNGLNAGALAGRFRREAVCGRSRIVDFCFPEVRLAIEVDGAYHRSTPQRSQDRFKETALGSAGIMRVRVTNEEVFGDRARPLGKLRQPWREALQEARRPAGTPRHPALRH